MAWKTIKLAGLFIKLSNSGKVLKCSVADIDKLADDLKVKLTKRPTWRTNYSDKEREFCISLKGSVGEMWPDEEEQQPQQPDEEEEIF